MRLQIAKFSRSCARQPKNHQVYTLWNETNLSDNAWRYLDSSQYASIFSQLLINADIFCLCDKAMILRLSLSSINISDPIRVLVLQLLKYETGKRFNFAAEMFFCQSRQKPVSSV